MLQSESQNSRRRRSSSSHSAAAHAAGTGTPSQRGVRALGGNRLAQQVLTSTFGRSDADEAAAAAAAATPKERPLFNDPTSAAREAYTSRR